MAYVTLLQKMVERFGIGSLSLPAPLQQALILRKFIAIPAGNVIAGTEQATGLFTMRSAAPCIDRVRYAHYQSFGHILKWIGK